MKSVSTLMFILLTQTILFSQDFAPIGAKWYIQVAEPFAPEWTGTLTNESIRDTFLKGLSCKIIFKSQPTIFNEIDGEYVLCQKGDSIYHYIKSIDSMNLVMDFGAEVGSSWESFDRANEHESFGTQKNYKYTVDSIRYLHLNNEDSLRIQHLSVLQKDWNQPDSEYIQSWQKDELIEKLGFKSALLPTNVGDGFTDGQFETNIRCYQDNEIGLIKLTEEPNCIATSTIDHTFTTLGIYPNPSNGIITFHGLKNIEKTRVVVTNVSGHHVGEFVNQKMINISHLNNGIYLIRLISEGSMITKKIILLK